MGWAGAAAQVVGAGIGYLGSRSANKANERASAEAIAFEREREAKREANFREATAQHQARVQYQDALRSALLSRLGFDVGSVPTTPPISGRAGGAVPRQLPAGPSGPYRPPMGAPQQLGPSTPPMSGTPTGMMGGRIRDLIQPGPEEMSAWNDWEVRGLRSL